MSTRRLLGGVAGAATMIAVLTVASRVFGFGRWLVQSATVQASAVGEAYAAANLLPNVLFEVVAGGALAGAVIPLLAAPLARSLAGDVNKIASALLTWALVVTVPVAVAVSVCARPIAEILPASEDSPAAAQVDLTTFFLTIFAPQVVLYAVGVVLTGVLQAHRRFLAPVLAPIASTLVVIVSYLVFGALAGGMQNEPERLSDAALAWLAWGTTAGVAALSLPLLIPVRRCGVRLRLTLRFPPGVAVRARALALAGLGSLLAQQAAVLTVFLTARASGVVGTFNIFQYLQAVYLLPYAVLAVPLATAVFPRLAELATHSDRTLFVRTAGNSTRAVLAISILGAAVLVAVAPAVEVFFSRWNDTAGMASGLSAMAPALVGLGLIFHINRVLFSVERNRDAVIATAAGWISVALACLAAVRLLAPDGADGPRTLLALGVGHSVGMTVAGIGLFIAFARIQPGALAWPMWRTCAVGTAGGVLGAALGRFAAMSVLDLAGSSLVSALLGGALGAVLALAVVATAVALADRGILSVLRRTRV